MIIRLTHSEDKKKRVNVAQEIHAFHSSVARGYLRLLIVLGPPRRLSGARRQDKLATVSEKKRRMVTNVLFTGGTPRRDGAGVEKLNLSRTE